MRAWVRAALLQLLLVRFLPLLCGDGALSEVSALDVLLAVVAGMAPAAGRAPAHHGTPDEAWCSRLPRGPSRGGGIQTDN